MTHAQKMIEAMVSKGGITKADCDAMGINNFYEKIYAMKRSGVEIVTEKTEARTKIYRLAHPEKYMEPEQMTIEIPEQTESDWQKCEAEPEEPAKKKGPLRRLWEKIFKHSGEKE